MELETFVSLVRTAGTPEDVSRLLSQIGATVGFPTHIISPVPSEEMPVHDSWFLVQNWPEDWSRAYDDEGFAEFDPVPRAVATLHTPITMTEIKAGAAGFVPDPRAAQIWKRAAEMGRPYGYIVPIHGPLGYRAIVCFAGPGPDPDIAAETVLHVAALQAHDRVRLLARKGAGGPASLSLREIETVKNAATGLSDSEIAECLGISVRTVRFHLTNVRVKLGASNRAQAIAFATERGFLHI